MPPTITFSREQPLEDILYELREIAYQTTHREEWEAIVRPWMMRQQIKIRNREKSQEKQKYGVTVTEFKTAEKQLVLSNGDIIEYKQCIR